MDGAVRRVRDVRLALAGLLVLSMTANLALTMSFAGRETVTVLVPAVSGPSWEVSGGGAAMAAALAGRRSGSMKTVLEGVTSDAVDAEHVRRRVEDWEERLNGLYAMIGEWLPDGWEARRGVPVVMHAKMMQAFGVEAKRLPRPGRSEG